MAPSPLQGRVFDRYQQFKTLSTTLQQQTQAAAEALVQHKVFGVQPSSIFSFSSVYGVRSDTVVDTILKTVSNREEAERIVDGLVLSGVLALQNEDATAATTLEGFASGKNTIFVPTDNEVAGRKNQLSVWSLRQGAIQAGAIKRPGGLFSKPRDAYAIAHETRKALYLFDSDASLQVKDSMELQNAFVEFEKSFENGIKVSNPTSSIVFGVPTGMQDEWLNSIINAGATYREAYSGNVDQVKSIYELKDRDMAGHDVSMEQYKGKVILAVNVSSLCGLTPTNYPELAALDVKYRDQGLQILAFPCNQFAHQEPGSHEEIVEFVKQYHCEFPFFEKQDVNGANARPVFTYLKAKLPGSFGNFVKWNFTKFLVDRNGQPFKRYAPKDLPFSFEEDIKALLAQESASQ